MNRCAKMDHVPFVRSHSCMSNRFSEIKFAKSEEQRSLQHAYAQNIYKQLTLLSAFENNYTSHLTFASVTQRSISKRIIIGLVYFLHVYLTTTTVRDHLISDRWFFFHYRFIVYSYSYCHKKPFVIFFLFFSPLNNVH